MEVAEGSAWIIGTLGSSDPDDGATKRFTLSEGSEEPAGFVLWPNGNYWFKSNHDAYDHLNIGDSELLTISVTVTDEHGATDTTQIQITVTGTNDAPSATVQVVDVRRGGGSNLPGN